MKKAYRHHEEKNMSLSSSFMIADTAILQLNLILIILIPLLILPDTPQRAVFSIYLPVLLPLYMVSPVSDQCVSKLLKNVSF